MKKFITHVGLLALTLFATIFLGLSAVNAQSTYTEAPTVTSDKDEYSPGEVAHITGKGWTLDDSVHVEFKETPDYPDFHVYDIDVKSDGTWQLDYQVETRHIGVVFTVVADGKQSNKENKCGSGNEHPPAKPDTVRIILQPLLHEPVCSGYSNNRGQQNEFQKRGRKCAGNHRH